MANSPLTRKTRAHYATPAAPNRAVRVWCQAGGSSCRGAHNTSCRCESHPTAAAWPRNETWTLWLQSRCLSCLRCSGGSVWRGRFGAENDKLGWEASPPYAPTSLTAREARDESRIWGCWRGIERGRSVSTTAEKRQGGKPRGAGASATAWRRRSEYAFVAIATI